MDTIFVFWIIIALITGVVTLLYPVARRLGGFLDEWLALRRAEQQSLGSLHGQIGPLLERLEKRLAQLESEQERLQEHQEFMQSLLEKKEAPAIGRGSTGERSTGGSGR